jgi:hypothetical protein
MPDRNFDFHFCFDGLAAMAHRDLTAMARSDPELAAGLAALAHAAALELET